MTRNQKVVVDVQLGDKKVTLNKVVGCGRYLIFWDH